jgi:hypothetical protein
VCAAYVGSTVSVQCAACVGSTVRVVCACVGSTVSVHSVLRVWVVL